MELNSNSRYVNQDVKDILTRKNQVESAFEGTVLEGKKRRYTVLNERDFHKYVPENLRHEFGEIFNDVLFHIESGREEDGKNPYNSYLVINVDEPYTTEIIEVMKKNGHFE